MYFVVDFVNIVISVIKYAYLKYTQERRYKGCLFRYFESYRLRKIE